MPQNINQEREQVVNLFFVFTGEVAKILDPSLFQLFEEIVISDTPPAATIDRLKSEVFNSSPILMELVAKLEDDLQKVIENSKQDENDGGAEDENYHGGVKSMDVDERITVRGKSLATFRKKRAGQKKAQSTKKRKVGLGGSKLDDTYLAQLAGDDDEEWEEQTPPKKKKKRIWAECSTDGCTNQAQKGGVCMKHGAKRKLCSTDGCTNFSLVGGVCVKHGAKRKLCSTDGCTNQAQEGGVCIKHGAKVKLCSSEGCTNQARIGGVCMKHGAKRKLCSTDGCTNFSQKGGVCIKHGAKRKRKLCSTDGCTNQAKIGGVCIKHGAKVKLCSSEGCTNQATQKGGVCKKHGAKVKLCC